MKNIDDDVSEILQNALVDNAIEAAQNAVLLAAATYRSARKAGLSRHLATTMALDIWQLLAVGPERRSN